MDKTLNLRLDRETKGTLVYVEIDDSGELLDVAQATMPTVYIRKSAMEKPYPTMFQATLKSEG